MASCDILSIPFTLPKGFDPEGTKIVRCIDPDLGVLRANDDVVFTFLIEKQCGEIILFDSSVGSMKKIGEIKPGHYKILFASPLLPVSSHTVCRSKIDVYYNAMVVAWEKQSSPPATPSTAPSAASSISPSATPSAASSVAPRSFMSNEFMFNGQKCYRILSQPLKDVLYHHVNREKKVVGYKICGSEVPGDLINLIKKEYPSFVVDEDYIREAGFPEDNNGMAYSRDGKTYFKIFSGLLKHVIRERTSGNDKVVGFKEVGRSINGELYDVIRSHHPNWTFEPSILPSSLRGSSSSSSSTDISAVLPPKYKSEVAYFNGVCYYRIVNTALADIIYSIKSPVAEKKLIVGYQNLGNPPFPALIDLIKSSYPEFIFEDSLLPSSVPSSASTTEFKVQNYRDICHVYIVTEGELKDVLLHMKSGKHVIGYKTLGAKLPKELFYKIYVNYGFSIDPINIPHSENAQYIPFQNFNGAQGDCKIIFDGPMEGVVFRIVGDKNVVLGLGPRLQLLDRQLAAHIIFHHGDGNFVVPDDVVEPLPLKFEPSRIIGFFDVSKGPLAGLCVAQRKRFWYATKHSAAELSPGQIELIKTRYPNIVLP